MLSCLEEFGTRSYSGGCEQNSQFNTRAPEIPKFHQLLSGIIMHTFGIQR
jgi:hypothetical protein